MRALVTQNSADNGKTCFTDFHSHVLPGIDDGSRDIGETLELLAAEYSQGAGRVVATPHFYAQEMSVGNFLRRRREALETVLDRIGGRQDMPELLCGAEVYYFPGMGKAGQLSELVIRGTNLLLLEMPFAQWTDHMVEDVRQIIQTQKLTVVLAHLERFYRFQKETEQIESILSLPVVIQVNGGCLLDWKRRRLFQRICKEGRPVILGSDCHNMRNRLPNLAQAREIIEKKYGTGLLGEFDQNADNLLEGFAV